MAITIYNPNNWRGIRSQTCFGCAHRVPKDVLDPESRTYCGVDPKITFLDGNLRPSLFTCNLWKPWRVSNE